MAQGKCAWQAVLCFMDFRNAIDIVSGAVLWQVLEGLGVHGRFLDIIKYMTAVRIPYGLSEICRCLMGVKQGCLLSPTASTCMPWRSTCWVPTALLRPPSHTGRR